MNEIAVFLEEKDIISSFEEAKYVKIFTKDKFVWKVKKVILINRTSGKKGINEIRKEYQNILPEMDDCKILVVTKAFGIPYSVFYMEDFSIWELEGNPYDFLDEIVAKELEEEENANKPVELAKKIKDGYYLVDLQELELTNPEISSKNAIIPYLEKEEVKKIEVLCCHVPPWIVERKDKYNIKLDIIEIKRNDYKVIIEKNNN
ncbi:MULTISPECIES: Fe-only nitrogenase accessory AnfO family protein [unclassified Clostridium]|uniref:Fe-only nitrogenase accessory AnfO family protein n=1 Tax=unclassified Clostridium TaxID=2614128 RepID=UPI0002980043|nr:MULTISPECIES: Fe-only nitrogenase accessory AnfO family protein [unclassified Clostridium]EKQ52348.1 MAG: Iron only nitrogenase protein AnfO [Clostridium sp. Maddingley MBC34-26]